MAKVRITYDKKGRTLTVWFGNPEKEYVCEETGNEVVIMKDRRGKVIGFEKLNFTTNKSHLPRRIETVFA
ncbi:MAG: DUF2283 domain-containing protein [Planctomycetes bacterium RBG_16_43_13]|nr:MAG: DUF2283 domain-containing protein [Planctomycetes bacterium RBG_16_43_13]